MLESSNILKFPTIICRMIWVAKVSFRQLVRIINCNNYMVLLKFWIPCHASDVRIMKHTICLQFLWPRKYSHVYKHKINTNRSVYEYSMCEGDEFSKVEKKIVANQQNSCKGFQCNRVDPITNPLILGVTL